MDAKELRIGNWVQHEPYPDEQWKVTIQLMESIELELVECVGIPLTPEILLACGFKMIQEGSMSHPEIWRIKYKQVLVTKSFDLHNRDTGEYSWIEGNTIVHNYSIHQLQNLYFALTGTELQYQSTQQNKA